MNVEGSPLTTGLFIRAGFTPWDPIPAGYEYVQRGNLSPIEQVRVPAVAIPQSKAIPMRIAVSKYPGSTVPGIVFPDA